MNDTTHSDPIPEEDKKDPQTHSIRRQLLIWLGILVFLIAGTVSVVLYARGNRIDFTNGTPIVTKTGILGVTSTPDGAQIYINGHLQTATNSNINLTPGEYDIKITKDGYFDWEKKVKIQKEIATKVDALLFPLAPQLEGLATAGVEDPVLDPSGTKIAFRMSNSSIKKNGLYVLDMNTRPLLTLQSSATQIVDDTTDIFSKASYSWSPDGKDLLASISAMPNTATYYDLKTSGFNDTPQDVTPILSSVLDQWQLDQAEKDKARLTGLRPKTMQQLIQDNFSVLSWSPDETKILYVASRSADLPLIIKPRLLGINNLNEERSIHKGSIYVYDTKEDTNNKIFDSLSDNCSEEKETATCHAPLTWFPDSEHLIWVNDKKITIMEYDGSNHTTVYAGPFEDSYVFPYPNGTKLVILTNLGNLSAPPTLYSIGLK